MEPNTFQVNLEGEILPLNMQRIHQQISLECGVLPLLKNNATTNQLVITFPESKPENILKLFTILKQLFPEIQHNDRRAAQFVLPYTL